MRRPLALAVFLATLIGIFYGLTLQPGQDWGGDWALYVSHAISLANGAPYTQTPYFADRWSHVSPDVYPPVLPFMLAPLFKCFGFALMAFKWVYISCFVAVLISSYLCFQERITRAGALATLLLIGLNPFFWRFKESVLSDIPFLAACLLCLCWMQTMYTRFEASNAQRRLLPGALLLGFAMYAGYGLREVGLVLPLTALGYELVVLRRLTPIAPTALAFFALLAWAQHVLMQSAPSDPALVERLAALDATGGRTYSHLNFFHVEPAFLWDQAWRYKKAFWGFLCHGVGTHGRVITEVGRLLTHGLTLLLAIGYLRSLFTRITVFELFCAGYFCVILSFAGFHGVRYLIPLFPFVIYYAILGFQWSTQKLKPGIRIGVACTLCLSTLGLYGHSFAKGPSPGIEYGVTSPPAMEVWAYLKKHAQPDDVVVTRKPRIVGLMTGLSSCAYPDLSDPIAYAEYFEIIGVDYVLALTPLANDELYPNPKLPLIMQAALEGRLQAVFQNDYFMLYEYHMPVQAEVLMGSAK